MKKIIPFLFTVMLFAQNGPGTLSPVVTYWKTLSSDEKEIFLFSYLTQVYETHTELKNSEGYGGFTEWYYNNRAELIYGIFDKLEEVKISEMAKWIDEYYSHGEYANRPFFEALEFAYRFADASGATMWEKYENLKFEKIKPGKN
jgi:hypothetical protein